MCHKHTTPSARSLFNKDRLCSRTLFPLALSLPPSSSRLLSSPFVRSAPRKMCDAKRRAVTRRRTAQLITTRRKKSYFSDTTFCSTKFSLIILFFFSHKCQGGFCFCSPDKLLPFSVFWIKTNKVKLSNFVCLRSELIRIATSLTDANLHESLTFSVLGGKEFHIWDVFSLCTKLNQK